MSYGYLERARSSTKSRIKKPIVISSQIDINFHSAYLRSKKNPVIRINFFSRNEGDHLNAIVLDIKKSVACDS